MADQIDDYSDLGAVEVEDFSDLGAIPVEEEKSEEPVISKTESAILGARQGATMGFADEAEAALGSGLDIGQQILNKLGLAKPSPSQVGEALKQKGVTGDVGPTDAQEIYVQLRDETRASEKAAQEANPLSYGAGALAGGIATAPLLPGAVLAPIKAAKDATLLAKIGAGAASAVPTGAIAGLGLGESDLTQGDYLGIAKDTAMGAGTGALVGGALPVAGAGLKAGKEAIGKLGKKVMPEILQDAYAKGAAGIDITSPEFYEETSKKVIQKSEDVATPILQQIEKQKSVNVAKVADLDDQINNLNKQAEQAVKVGEAKQLAQNADDIRAIDKQTVGLAKNIQKRVYEVKKSLGKQYDEIDKAAEATGIAPENRDVVGEFQETLTNMSGLPETEVNSIMKKIAPTFGNKDLQSFRNLKQTLSNYFEHANPVVRRAAKTGYANLKNNYAKELNDNGFGEIANRMTETNKRWSAISEMEEQFLSNLKPNRITGEIEASPDTISAITKSGQKTAKEMAESEQLAKMMQVADPEQAKQTLKQMEALASKTAEAKTFKPDVPQLPNPEVQRLQNLLAQAKGEVPEVIPGLDVNLSSDKALKDELINLIPKIGTKSGDDIAEKRVNQIFDYVSKTQGKEVADKLKNEMSVVAKDVRLRDVVTRQQNKVPASLQDVGEKLAGGVVGLANKTALKQSNNLKNKILQTGVKKLSDATPEQLKELGNQMSQLGAEGAAYAKVLSGVTDKNAVSRNAIVFGLMQQPKFREILRKVNGEQAEEDGETER